MYAKWMRNDRKDWEVKEMEKAYDKMEIQGGVGENTHIAWCQHIMRSIKYRGNECNQEWMRVNNYTFSHAHNLKRKKWHILTCLTVNKLLYQVNSREAAL